MVTFIIPVKSSKVSNDWSLFCKLFERTLRSVCQQKDKNYRVVVVCHEIPKINFESPKVVYHIVDFPPPHLANIKSTAQNGLKELDKSKKILEGLKIANSYGTSYVMVVDSDDCISKNVISIINNSDKNIVGWYMKQGFIYKESSKIVFLNKENFNTLCGTSIIIKPQYLTKLLKERPFLYYSHEIIELDKKISLTPFPSPAVIYSIANGENHLMSKDQATSFVKKYKTFGVQFFKSLLRKIRKYRLIIITPHFRNKFGLYKI